MRYLHGGHEGVLTRRYVKFIEICAEKCRVLDALYAEKCIFAYKLCA